MRKILGVLFVLLLSCPLMSQTQTGDIYGKIVDTEGDLLPGVTVTLTGTFTAPMTSITSAQGIFRFLRLAPANDYTIRTELAGFRTEIRENIIVTVGANVEINLTMEMGRLEEEVTVTALTPVVDTKKTVLGQTVSREIMQSLPSARDPWVVIQMAPSVAIDRENVSGSQGGQQSGFSARGTDADRSWEFDGIKFSAEGSGSANYFDFDSYEEMQITVGGQDVTQLAGGVVINMVTRRGGNKVSIQGRFFVADEYFQAENMTDELKAEGVAGTNKIRQNKDYGFNIGLPIIRDKIWFMGAYSVQDLRTYTVYGSADDTVLANYMAKINLQLVPENRFEAWIHANNKQKWGRGQTAENPEGMIQEGFLHWGVPTAKIQDEHMIGDNLLLTFKYIWNNLNYKINPMMDKFLENVTFWDVTDARWYGSFPGRYYLNQTALTFRFNVDYFNDDLFGASHAMKFGVEYLTRKVHNEAGGAGNFIIRRNYNTATVDYDGDGLPDVYPNIKRLEVDRGYYYNVYMNGLALYLQDTLSFGRFNIIAGLRYDIQTPSILPFTSKALDTDNPAVAKALSSSAVDAIEGVLPGIKISEIEATAADGSRYNWKNFSPRIGITYDITGDGKTIAKLFFGMYPDRMEPGEAERWSRGGAQGWMDLWWLDQDGNGMTDVSELYWHRTADYGLYRVFNDAGGFIGDLADASGVMWGAYDPLDPTKTTDPYQLIDKKAASPRTTEFILTLEREVLPDFGVSLNFTYRKYDKLRWDEDLALMYYPDTGEVESRDWYESAGKIPATVGGFDTKDAAGKDWYVLKPEYTYTPWEMVKLREDYYRDYWGIDLILNKRLSHKWMLNGSITLQNQAQHIGDKGLANPTNEWAIDGRSYTAYTYARWMFKFGGLYQLPYDVNVSFNFRGRQGWSILEYVDIEDPNLPNPISRSFKRAENPYGNYGLLLTPYASERLDMFYDISLRLEKMLKIGDTGRIYFMLDLFNVFNNKIIDSRYDRRHGTYNVATGLFSPDALDYRASAVMSPRILRLGVRFSF